ncbi:MFS transporter [Rhodoferax koreense]|uniref:MFS transporter n=1 Tax=Rhodoferax koreensis TaxID=1842727 RepID=A0A1P8K2D4_9BURK|nr:MFS transporter [Rhodoferax koreense]APW40155.1 MFS transporter [Rhodoferax koreense]
MTHRSTLTARDGLCYGLLGLPLAFVALPLYVLLPNHYAREFGVPLATLGWLLLGARLFDAFIDPLIGRASDRLFVRSTRAVLAVGAVAAVALAAGFTGLFFPATRSPDGLLLWAAAMLLLTYTAYSTLSVSHQAWGAMLGGDEARRSRIVAWREGLGLVGVVAASVLPLALGLRATTAIFFGLLALGWLAWRLAPRPAGAPTAAPAAARIHPLRQPAFRRLLAVFVLNGIASAVPATLVLFFVQDRLQAPAQMQPAFLGVYFVCAAAAMPLWLRLVGRIGLARTWLCGMGLAIAVFVWASLLGPGQTGAFLLVCALSGAALGTDLALPGALLAGLIAAQHPDSLNTNPVSARTDSAPTAGPAGAYFGWWNFATKLNLALAAGLALPLLALFGYSPGSRDPDALRALSLAYGVLPCGLKLAAAAALAMLVIRPARPSSFQPEPSP